MSTLFGITLPLPLPLPMFGLFVALAMLVAAHYLKRELCRLYETGRIGTARVPHKGKDGVVIYTEVPPQDVVPDLAVVVMFAGIAGARLFHILEHLDEFTADPWGMIFTTSGLSIFGGLILGTLAGLFCVRRWKLPLRPLLDAAAPAMMLGYAIGRIGCQVSGDGDWGIVSNMSLKPDWLPLWTWAQTYEHNIAGVVISAPGVYPTPLYETLMGIACFLLLWALRKHPFRMGWLFSVYMTLAGAERLLIEKIRINPVFNVFGIHATQAEIIAFLLILFGLFGIAILGRRLPTERLLSASASGS
ncbi:prolipoprotein diacylglyceryl transferase [Collimonas arenae]|uniref:prolipoprotein diacylglyceryl transferase n=1 Tax=Collimonas arenae TaxID=279058 RepID=UPI001E2D0977|nr:prolipoprotein diacylglyceryl transferase family protein [Collimonas arenae]